MSLPEFGRFFPLRKATSHKGNFGKIFILAGSRNFPGAPYLASMGALRAGAGLITLGVPESLYPMMVYKLAEVMVRPFPEIREGALGRRAGKKIFSFLKTQDVLAIGPGLGMDSETQDLVRQVISSWQGPKVVDADGLNALQGRDSILKKLGSKTIVTPHPGEAQRLFREEVPEDDAGRKKFAVEKSEKYGMVMVLKGHHTVVAAPGKTVYVNQTGNPGLATGGSGDILTGVIAAFLGQGLEPSAAAQCGVFIHGLAADLAVKKFGEISLAPTDVLDYLPAAFQKSLGRRSAQAPYAPVLLRRDQGKSRTEIE